MKNKHNQFCFGNIQFQVFISLFSFFSPNLIMLFLNKSIFIFRVEMCENFYGAAITIKKKQHLFEPLFKDHKIFQLKD